MEVANCINLARCQLPAAVSQGSTKTYQMCFTTLVWWDLVWWDCIGDPIQGLHTCLPTQTADLPSGKFCSGNFAHPLFRCTLPQMQMQMLISKVTDCRDLPFSSTHFQVPIKIFSLNRVVAVLEYFSTNLQDWV